MQNLNIIDTKYIKRIFDIKGSSVDRKTGNLTKVENTTILKDEDVSHVKVIDKGV